MTVRLRLDTKDRHPRETIAELTGDAGFDPEVLASDSVQWKFYNREWADTFAIAAQFTRGVLRETVERIG